jgi:DNA mismatch repair protein MutS2
VANIARMLEICEAPALVLLDEVGTGTDPEEGSALGVAVVDHFRRACGAHVIATTHYSGLKMYAGTDPDVINASVEFNEKTLRPTYRLLVGLAGASSGLEIARRFGVPKPIVDVAVSSVKESSLQASEYLRRIKHEAEEAEALRLALEEERRAVAEKFASLDKEAAQRERERQAAFEQLTQRAVADLEKRARELVGKIEDRTERIRAERDAQRHVAEMKRAAQTAANTTSPGLKIVRDGRTITPGTSDPSGVDAARVADQTVEYVKAAPREIVAGDKVKLLSFGSVGVVDKIKDGYAEVRVKALRFREKLENLELVEQQAAPKAQRGKLEKLRRSAGTEIHLAEVDQQVRSELNVIGRTTDEAVDAVDKFLDEASLASLSQVRIVHGHGTGALRRAIAGLLSDHPHVARFVAAPPDQGGTGATLVELRQ